MKRCGRGLLMAAVVLLLFSALAGVVGCSSGGEDGNGGSPAEALALMDKVPESAGDFDFVNVKALRDDRDLAGLYEGIKDELPSEVEDMGIPADNVDSVVEAGYLTILEGRFDLATVETVLESSGYEKSDYKGTPLWEEAFGAVGLVSGSCIVAGLDVDEVKGCLDVIGGTGSSLRDNAEVADIMGRVPDGFAVMVYVQSSDWEIVEGARTIAYSMAKKGSDKARATMVFAFADAKAAGDAEDDMEDFVKYEAGDEGATNVSVTRDGKYLKAGADIDLAEALD